MQTVTRVRDALKLEPGKAVAGIAENLRRTVADVLKRRGAVVAMSGGVDSSVCAGLAVRALGPKRVFGLLLPEAESGAEDLALGREWAERLGIAHRVEDISGVLAACGAYARRDEAIRSVVPAFGPGWSSKITVDADRHARDGLTVFHLTVKSPDGELQRHRLPPVAYREIVAATNFKQRVRKMLEYHHADRLHYAVVGTPNRLEYDQGFFVKGGDGLADVKPIAHLYKTQVYQLARELGVPEGVTARPPTTGTYSLPQTQEEFYWGAPVEVMDMVLYGCNHGVPAEEVAEEVGMSRDAVAHMYRDIARRRSTTRYLHLTSVLLEPVPEIA
jgi:NAD+ synthase